ncbi:hypothetical protein ABMA75_03170 [Halobacteriovorax sp. ZH4_bin.1]|uniref:hypothetical protein n=1 Tax=unclassified Halobacteriovorax TaxID=2639665 RepID=UPI00371C0672
MGLFDFFDDVADFVEDEILEPIGKDIIPAAAAFATGGTSLAFLPPSESGILSDVTEELLGVDAKTLTKAFTGGITGGLGGAPKQAPKQAPRQTQQVQQAQFTQAPQTPVVQQQVAQAQVVQQPRSTSDVINSPQVGNNAPQIVKQGMDTNTMMLIGGGVLGLFAILMMNKK